MLVNIQGTRNTTGGSVIAIAIMEVSVETPQMTNNVTTI